MDNKYFSRVLVPAGFSVNKIVKYVGRDYWVVYTLDIYFDFNNAQLSNIGLFESYEDAYAFGTTLLSKGYSDLLDDPTFQLVRSPYLEKEDENV